MKFWLSTVGVILIIALVIWGTFQFKRSWNYNWAYKDRVEATAKAEICDMVKREHLVDPTKCE